MTSLYNGYVENDEVTAARWKRIRLQGQIVILQELLKDSECECNPRNGLSCHHCQQVSELNEKLTELQELQGSTELYFYKRR